MIANHGTIPVFMLQPADIIVVGGRVVVVLGANAHYVDGKPIYSFNGVVTTADEHGNIDDAVQTFTDFTADATFPRLLVAS